MKLRTLFIVGILSTLFGFVLWQNGIVVGERITALKLYQVEKAERELCQYGKRIK